MRTVNEVYAVSPALARMPDVFSVAVHLYIVTMSTMILFYFYK